MAYRLQQILSEKGNIHWPTLLDQGQNGEKVRCEVLLYKIPNLGEYNYSEQSGRETFTWKERLLSFRDAQMVMNCYRFIFNHNTEKPMKHISITLPNVDRGQTTPCERELRLSQSPLPLEGVCGD